MAGKKTIVLESERDVALLRAALSTAVILLKNEASSLLLFPAAASYDLQRAHVVEELHQDICRQLGEEF